METQQHNIENTEKQPTSELNTQPLTPQELVQHHMEHPDEPITDAQMENLDVGTSTDAATGTGTKLTEEEKKKADELAAAIKSDGTDMAYEADV